MLITQWLKLPLLARSGLSILGLIVLLSLAPWLGGMAWLLAAALWGSVIVGVLYASGQCRWLDRYAALSRFLAVYAPRLESSQGAAATSSVPDAPSTALPPAADVSAFVGLDDVWQHLHEFLESTSEVTSIVQPATLVLLVGQKGTGKSSVSAALAVELYKRQIVKSSHIETISLANTPGLIDTYGLTAEAHSLINTRLHQALDGVLRIEDLDDNSPVELGAAIAALGSQLLSVARTYPGRLYVICTGSPTAVAHLNHCLGQLHVQRIAFEALDDEALSALFRQLVETHGLQLAEQTAGALQYKIQEIKDEQGAAFENAYTIHKLFDQVNYARGLRVRQLPDFPEQDRRLVQREDIQRASLMP